NKTGAITISSPVSSNLAYSINGGVFQSLRTYDNLNPGSYSFVVRDLSIGCNSLSSVAYGINPPPLASKLPIVGLNERYCEGDTGVQLRALGQNLLWYDNATGGTGSIKAPVPSTQRSGTVTYYVTQQLPGFCESNRLSVPVTVYAKPLAEAGEDKLIVEGQ
ncbi:MAG: hypothetical protein ACK5XN_26770, partial [Bacteroidota bacterium]